MNAPRRYTPLEYPYLTPGVAVFSIEIFENVDSPKLVELHRMRPGMSLHIPPMTIHRINATDSKSMVEILEVSTQHFESDSYRVNA